jgi:hypothetical protein
MSATRQAARGSLADVRKLSASANVAVKKPADTNLEVDLAAWPPAGASGIDGRR